LRLPVLFARAALHDLDRIFDFIAEDNPRRARSYVADIRAACQRLGTTPFMGVDRADIRTDLRVMPLWRRLVVAYQVEPDRVRILRVFAAGQDYEAIMRDG